MSARPDQARSSHRDETPGRRLYEAWLRARDVPVHDMWARLSERDRNAWDTIADEQWTWEQAAFASRERMKTQRDRLLDHVHGDEHTGPMEGCEKCIALVEPVAPPGQAGEEPRHG